MNVERFDDFAKASSVAGSRRYVIRGLLGGLLGLSRVAAAEANHKIGHHCTPSDQHACAEGQSCREVSGAWKCQNTCLALGEVCVADDDCCVGLRCCPSRLCESAIDNCDGLD